MTCWLLLLALYVLCGLGVFVVLRLARCGGWALALATALWPLALATVGAFGIIWDIKGRFGKWRRNVS